MPICFCCSFSEFLIMLFFKAALPLETQPIAIGSVCFCNLNHTTPSFIWIHDFFQNILKLWRLFLFFFEFIRMLDVFLNAFLKISVKYLLMALIYIFFNNCFDQTGQIAAELYKNVVRILRVIMASSIYSVQSSKRNLFMRIIQFLRSAFSLDGTFFSVLSILVELEYEYKYNYRNR